MTCQQSLLDRLSSEDEDDIIFSDEKDKHNAWGPLLGRGGARRPGHVCGKLVSSKDEELARTALSCHLWMNLFCQEMHAFQE